MPRLEFDSCGNVVANKGKNRIVSKDNAQVSSLAEYGADWCLPARIWLSTRHTGLFVSNRNEHGVRNLEIWIRAGNGEMEEKRTRERTCPQLASSLLYRVPR